MRPKSEALKYNVWRNGLTPWYKSLRGQFQFFHDLEKWIQHQFSIYYCESVMDLGVKQPSSSWFEGLKWRHHLLELQTGWQHKVPSLSVESSGNAMQEFLSLPDTELSLVHFSRTFLEQVWTLKSNYDSLEVHRLGDNYQYQNNVATTRMRKSFSLTLLRDKNNNEIQ